MAVYRFSLNGINIGERFTITGAYAIDGFDAPNTNAYALAIAQAMTSDLGDGTNIVSRMLTPSTNSLVTTSLQVLNLYNDYDFAEVATVNSGSRNETPEGSAATYLFGTTRIRRDIARGLRYVPGVTASAFNGNELSPGYRGFVGTAADAMNESFTLTSLSSEVAYPVVLGLYKDPVTGRYGKYPSQELQEEHMYAASWDASGEYPKLRWLRSRQNR